MCISNVISISCIVIFTLLELVLSVSSSMGVAGYVVFCSVFLLLPVSYLFIAMFLLNRNIKAKNWPYVTGKITDTEYNPSTFGDTFSLSYSYFVKDRMHNSKRFDHIKQDIRMSDLFNVLTLKTKSYSQLEGTAVRVYYDPKNAWNAVLCNKVILDFTGLILPSFNALIVSFYLFYKVVL